MQLISRILRDFQVNLQLRDFVKYSTVADLASFVIQQHRLGLRSDRSVEIEPTDPTRLLGDLSGYSDEQVASLLHRMQQEDP